jgi:methyl-accepting chemotaxis protein
MRRKSFKTRIIIPTVVVLTALVVALNIFLSIEFSSQSDSLINEKLAANTNSLKLYLDNSKANSRAAAVSMALNPVVIKAIRERDTNALLRIFTPTQRLYQINYYTICDSEGVVLARTHEPENFGDSVLGQQNIKDALGGRVSTYFEEGTVVKVSVRTGSPVYDTDGKLIGVVSAGVRFDLDSAVNELKEHLESEVTIFLGDIRIATTITRNGQSIAGTPLNPEIAKVVIQEKREYSGNAKIIGEKYKTFYMPLLNSKNEVFAVFFSGIPEAETLAVFNRSIRNGILLGLGGLAVSIILMFFIISSISEPIIRLSGEMDRIARGNLNINIDVKSDDEIGLLAESFQRVSDTIHTLLDEINMMIAEHEIGNTEYSVNAAQFQGDFQSLARSILKFASFGLKDQLTGIANRRSFDNRLNWEWKKAVSDSIPISILIMDMDNFKKYNDIFGHQQSDVALQTVVKTIKQSVRPLDFLARWDGDEIMLLLPSTDSNDAATIAEKIRKDIEKALVPSAELAGVKVTVSIGVNTQTPTPGKSADRFISLADTALYKAKETGRNKVVVAEA